MKDTIYVIIFFRLIILIMLSINYLSFYILIFLSILSINFLFPLDQSIYIITCPILLFLSTIDIITTLAYFLFLYTPSQIYYLTYLFAVNICHDKFYGCLLFLLFGALCGVRWLKLFSNKCTIDNLVMTLFLTFIMFSIIGNWYLDYIVEIFMRLDFLRLWFWTNIVTAIIMETL